MTSRETSGSIASLDFAIRTVPETHYSTNTSIFIKHTYLYDSLSTSSNLDLSNWPNYEPARNNAVPDAVGKECMHTMDTSMTLHYFTSITGMTFFC